MKSPTVDHLPPPSAVLLTTEAKIRTPEKSASATNVSEISFFKSTSEFLREFKHAECRGEYLDSRPGDGIRKRN